MKKKEKNFKVIQLQTEQTLEDRQELKQLLLGFDLKSVENKFTDENLDRENLKIQLLSGEVIDLNSLKVVSSKLQEYLPRFPNDFYVQIFRLNGWKIPDSGKISEKPHLVGTWTNEIIYGRFSRLVLPTLEHFNPIDRIGLRKHKHHQHLNEDGLTQLKAFISQSVELMKECSDWYSFRIRLNQEHGVPFQLNMWEERARNN